MADKAAEESQVNLGAFFQALSLFKFTFSTVEPINFLILYWLALPYFE